MLISFSSEKVGFSLEKDSHRRQLIITEEERTQRLGKVSKGYLSTKAPNNHYPLHGSYKIPKALWPYLQEHIFISRWICNSKKQTFSPSTGIMPFLSWANQLLHLEPVWACQVQLWIFGSKHLLCPGSKHGKTFWFIELTILLSALFFLLMIEARQTWIDWSQRACKQFG